MNIKSLCNIFLLRKVWIIITCCRIHFQSIYVHLPLSYAIVPSLLSINKIIVKMNMYFIWKVYKTVINCTICIILPFCFNKMLKTNLNKNILFLLPHGVNFYDLYEVSVLVHVSQKIRFVTSSCRINFRQIHDRWHIIYCTLIVVTKIDI